MMKIHIDTISSEGLYIEEKVPSDAFAGLLEMSQKKDCRFLSPVRIKVDIKRFEPFITVTGNFLVRVELTCSRCLGAYGHDLSAPFTITFSQVADDPVAPASESDGEWTGEDADLFEFHGDVLDLEEAIQEQVILALPFKPLCQTDCKGLCNGCGADLNNTACTCKKDNIDPRFAVLKNLKID